MVCKEGYGSQPKDLLGAYCYCMKLRSGEGFGAVPEVGVRPDTLQIRSYMQVCHSCSTPVLTEPVSSAWMSVSHFNLIHSSCHQAARQAASALRAPKQEWERAALRNGETLWGGLSGNSSYSLLRLPPWLWRPLGIWGHPVGGEPRGRQSNARLLPYLFQLGHYFAGFFSNSDLQAQTARLDKLTVWLPAAAAPNSVGSSKDAATAYLPSAARCSCTLRFAFSQTQPGKSSGGSGSGAIAWSEQPNDAVWRCASPMVRVFGLVHHLQGQLKGVGEGKWRSQVKSGDPAISPGLCTMCNMLDDLAAAVEGADGMLVFLEKLEAATEPAGCFQVMGLQQAVVQPSQQGQPSDADCMQYIRQALCEQLGAKQTPFHISNNSKPKGSHHIAITVLPPSRE
ncbi:TPA: hypothetical protein ACH3X3_003498 [Trebouxia sp. C0006]